jgi:hypothetical protein
MKKGMVAINAQAQIINASTGEEIPPMFRKGGIKKFLELARPPTVSVGNITLEEGPVYGTLGPEGFVQNR